MSEAGVSGFSIWLLGVSLGLTACTVTCLPFIGTWVMGRNPVGNKVWFDAAAFIGGRLVAYGLLGGLAGALGAWFVRVLAEGWGNAAIGLAAIGAGLTLAASASKPPGCRLRPVAGRFSPFALGLALTLIPCAPLATLLAACAGAGDTWRGWALGSLFGLGTTLTPMLVFIPAIGGFARRLVVRNPWLATWLRCGAAVVLLLLGGRRLDLFQPLAGSIALALALPAAALPLWRANRAKRLGEMPDAAIRIVPERPLG